MENTFTDPHEFTLENGLRVVYTHYPHLSSFAISLIGKAGSIYESEGTTGVAHFLEHVVFDGTEKYPDESKVAELMEKIGGHSNAATGNEYVRFYATTLSKDAEKAFDLVSQVALHPLLKEESISKQKMIITEEINMYLSDPQAFAADKMMEILYPDSRLGELITGTIEDVSNIDKRSIQEFMDKNYSANNFVLSICGSLGPSEVQDLAQKYFKDMKKGDDAKPRTIKTPDEFKVNVENWKDLRQEVLMMSYYAPAWNSEKEFAFDILNFVFGRGELSRLFSTIREKHNLTYYVGSRYSSGPDFGHVSVYTGLSEANTTRFIDIYLKEVKNMVEKGISRDEFDRAINNFTASFLFKSDSTSSTAHIYGYDKLFSGNLKTFREIIEEYKKVSLEEVQQAAKELFKQKPKVSAIGSNVKSEYFDALR